MYPQFVDSRYPPEFGPGHGPIPMDPTAGGYPGYYSSKAPENNQFGGMSMSARGVQHYGGKPGAMAGNEGMYGHSWGPAMQSQGYMVPPGSEQPMGKMDFMYPGQPPDMYARTPPMPQGYGDSIPPPGMAGYPGVPHGYAPSPQYPGQYPYGSQRIPIHPGMIPAGMGGSPMMDGYAENMRGMGSPYPPPPGGPPWSSDPSRRPAMPSNMSRTMSQEMLGQSPGSWPPYRTQDGYPSPGTPGQQQQTAQQQQQQQQSQQQQTHANTIARSQMYRQQGQQQPLGGVMSPQAPYNAELQRQPSVSSLRDALLSSGPASVPPSQQQYQSYNSPRVAEVMNQPSPMTPTANLPHTPDASTPTGGSNVMSPPLKPPAFGDRQDSQMSAESELLESLSRQNSEASENPLAPVRVSQFQVEKILGIKDDKPVDIPRQVGDSNFSQMPPGGRDVNAMQSPQGNRVAPFGEHQLQIGDKRGGGFEGTEDGRTALLNSGGRPDSLSVVRSPTLVEPLAHQVSPALSQGRTAAKAIKTRRPPIRMSPVDRNHPSIMNQYNYSDEKQRKEFLDVLFAHLEKEGVHLVRLPTIGKAPLDLFRIYSCVQQLGGFINVMEKRLWNEVLQSFNSSASNPTSAMLRVLQQYYMKLLLPYECHVKNMELSECLVKFENSWYGGMMSPNAQSESITTKVNHHVSNDEASKLDEEEAVLDSLMDGRVNGESEPPLPDEGVEREATLGSQDSMQMNNQEDSQMAAVQDGQMVTQERMPSVGSDPDNQKHHDNNLDIPEGSQNSVDTYSQGISNMEQLPDISVQDAESLLGPTYPPPPPPGQHPGTPSGQGIPSPSSYPPQYPQQNSRDWAIPPGGNFMPSLDMNDPNMMVPPPPGHNPPGYPPAYPMDPMSGYPRPPSHHHSPHQQHGYPALYNSPDLPPQMMRSPYHTSDLYPGMPPSMSMVGYRPMEPNPFSSPYRSPVMHQASPMMRRMEEIPYGPSMGMPPGPEWGWQYRSRFPSPLPPHMQSPMYRQYPPTARPSTPQQSAAMQQQRASPVHAPAHDPIKIHWQDQMKAHAAKMAALKAYSHRQEIPTVNKVHPSRSSEQQALADSQKRPLPDWSSCVEGTKPQLVKRRRLYSGDCGHVEPWRVMMSLKSGLLAESTWALDTLNILLHDDRTVGFFYLKHHHSLLNTLVDHFRKTLIAIFGQMFATPSSYVSGCEGVDSCPLEEDEPSSKPKGKRKEKYTKEWLSRACTTDYDTHHSLINGNSNGQECNSERVFEPKGESSIPVARVYNVNNIKLGITDDLSHIQLPNVEKYPSVDEGPEVMKDEERRQLEDNPMFQRIDVTPVSELLQREALLNRIPLHRFGRLSRSPRRREKSFLEDMKLIEEMTKGEEEEESAPSKPEEGKATSKNSETARGTSKDEEVQGSKEKEVFTTKKFGEESITPPQALVLKEQSEIHQKESPPLWYVSSSQRLMHGRCMCLSNILRSLSFVPGNDLEFSQHAGILIILGHLLALHHTHLLRPKDRRHPIKKEEGESNLLEGQHPSEKEVSSYRNYWWWSCLDVLRENTLVILSNISGQLDLSIFPELISYPIVNGLLHWAVCPSAQAVDPMPDSALVLSLSPQRLVLEALAKMSITEANVDLLLATPPLTRLDILFSHLVHFIGQKKHPVVRQFALVLLSNLAQGNEVASRLISQQKLIVSLLLECIESSEHASCTSGGHLVGGYNPEDPNSLSVAMLRRAATTLHCLAKISASRTSFLPFRDRMLYLATSQYVEPSVSSILMDMLFELGKL